MRTDLLAEVRFRIVGFAITVKQREHPRYGPE